MTRRRRAPVVVLLLLVAAAGVVAWLATRGATPGAPARAGGYDANGRAPEGVVPAARPHVVLVCLEGVRRDAFAPAGAAASRTPRLARLAERGLRFPDAVAPAARGALSLACVLTGKTLRRNDAWTGELSEFEATLPEVLASVGYRTSAWLGSSVAQRVRGLRQGFPSFEVVDALDARAADVEAWAKAGGATPSFLLLHARPATEPAPANGAAGEALARLRRAEYDAALGRLDDEVAGLVERVERALSSPPLVVLFSTHGRAFLEHGVLGSGGALHEENVRVPLAVWGPGVPAGERRGSYGLVDVAATVLSALSMPPLEGGAVSLLGPAASPPDRVLEAQEYARLPSKAGPSNRILWSVRTSDAKYVADFDTLTTTGTESLYDLRGDPGETSPVPLDRLERFGAAFAKAVAEVRDGFTGKRTTQERLEQMGYTGEAGRDLPPPEDGEPAPPR